MASGSFRFDGINRLYEQLEDADKVVEEFINACAKELAARLLSKVIKRTPVGQYPSGSGKTGGTLRRGWTAGKGQGAASYAQSLQVHHYGGYYVIEITNPVEYASYVEFGHRTANHSGWVEGKFMLTISEQEIQAAAPGILERRLQQKLGELFT
jgi:hypothetical protein